MFGIGWMEVAILMTIGVFFMTMFLTIFAVVMKSQQRPIVAATPAAPLRYAAPPATHSMSPGEASISVVAQITQRFCPRCRAPLAADAPEGLCPACLMAGGFASAEALDPANGNAVTTPPSGSQPPTAGEWQDLAQHFPQLEIVELLGRGGMGCVYKVRQKHLDRMVALKVIPPEAAKDPAFAERFAREARALARLNHPNIVAVYDFGQNGDVYYLLMEYVDGVNLRHAQRACRLQPSEALAIVPQICDALQYAHDQGIVHRDIKPENVLLDRSGRVKIADFGLAKMLGKGPDDFTLTRTQQVMGTPRYMAPEQIEKPTSVDHRADIYSLGVVLYEMLTGELPIGRFQPPSQKVQLDVRIDGIVLRALEKEPDRRYQRASQVKTELVSAGQPAWQTPAPATKAMRADSDNIDRDAAGRRVQIPAVGLMVAGLMGLLFVASVLVYAFARQPMPSSVGPQAVVPVLTGLPPLGIVILSLGISLGGWQMSRLQSYGLATTSAVLALFPCTPAWMISLPMGIWALVVLRDPKVRAAFGAPLPNSMPSHRPPSPHPRGSGLAFGVGFGVAALLAGVLILTCGGLLAGLLLPAVQAARESARRMQSMNNLKQLGLAIHNYHDVFGSFPPAVVRDADGVPLYSGRVLLLPFLDQENLYRSFDLTQAWDSPRNQPVSQTLLTVFMDPSDELHELVPKTNYLFVTGAGTAFEADKTIQMSDITDGTSNTLAMIEVKGDRVMWAEPDDADFSKPNALPAGSHSGGNLALFVDGSVKTLPKTTSRTELREMATIDAGDLPWLKNAPVPIRPPVAPPVPIAPPAIAPPPATIRPQAMPGAAPAEQEP